MIRRPQGEELLRVSAPALTRSTTHYTLTRAEQKRLPRSTPLQWTIELEDNNTQKYQLLGRGASARFRILSDEEENAFVQEWNKADHSLLTFGLLSAKHQLFQDAERSLHDYLTLAPGDTNAQEFLRQIQILRSLSKPK